MAASTTDKLTATYNAANPNVARVTSTRTSGALTLACDNLAGWPTVSKVHFATYRINTSGAVIAGTQMDCYGIVSGNNITSFTRITGATDNGHSIGDVVEMMPTGSWAQGLYDWGTAHANMDGTLKTAAVQTALGISSSPTSDWNLLNAGVAPTTVTSNGNGSYDLVFATNDLTSVVSPGMRLRTTRTVAAPTQCANLNGTTQYFSKSSPAGMAQTDSITESIWIKPDQYKTAGMISRNNGTTDGWKFYLNSTGQVVLAGARAADDLVTSYQSVPLNKWTHVSASINTTTTTGVITINGVSVPVSYTNNANTGFLTPTQSLLIGATNGASPTDFFSGKLAQAASYSAVISVANILARSSQTMSGSETSLISAYSFNNVITDLNVTNANNLTNNGTTSITNADSFAGTQASGLISSTLDYAIVQKASYSTNTTLTVQVPEGCTIPTSGGVSNVYFASVGKPYGMSTQRGKWSILLLDKQNETTGSTSGGTYNPGGLNISIPIGEWKISSKGVLYINVATIGFKTVTYQLGTAPTLSPIGESQSTFYFNPTSAQDQMTPFFSTINFAATAVTPLYLQLFVAIGGTLANAPGIRGDNAMTVIEAENAYL